MRPPPRLPLISRSSALPAQVKVREDERTPVDLCHPCSTISHSIRRETNCRGPGTTRKSSLTPKALFAAGRASPRDGAPLSRLDLHYTPKHRSWLNMAEIELAVLTGQCLDRRLADQATLEREVAAGQAAPSASGRGVDRRFTTTDARIKLKHLYPAIQD